MVSQLVLIAYPLAAVAVVGFGVLALLVAFARERKHGAPSLDFFLAAKNSVGTITIAWSFYAAAMGSWALFSAPSYGSYAGILGVTFYAIAAGLPIVIIAYAGSYIRKALPSVVSLTHFTRKRFGITVQLYVMALALFNMGVALTAEYTTMGDLFEFVLGTKRLPMVIIVACTATIYTAIGGLYVSIITDQWQASLSVIVITVMVIYVAVTFDTPLPKLDQKALGVKNYWGLSSIGVMPLSLTTATVFSEAMWQRAWASSSERSLKIGAILGASAVTVAVFLLGFGGFLVAWANIPVDNYNTILFLLLNNKTWILVLVTVLSVTMSESSVDSLQNAIVDCIAGVVRPFFPKMSVSVVRVAVLLLNIPPVYVSLKKYNVLQLFLLANLVCTTSAAPLLMGLWWRSDFAQRTVTSFSMLFGCGCGLAGILFWTKHDQFDTETYSEALHRQFLGGIYDYPPFFISLGFSIVGVFVGAALEWVFRSLTCLPYPRVVMDDDEEVIEPPKVISPVAVV